MAIGDFRLQVGWEPEPRRYFDRPGSGRALTRSRTAATSALMRSSRARPISADRLVTVVVRAGDSLPLGRRVTVAGPNEGPWLSRLERVSCLSSVTSELPSEAMLWLQMKRDDR